jgi:hypothetical protein
VHGLKYFKIPNAYQAGLINNYKNYLRTYLVTYAMEQSPSWEANQFAASQEIPRNKNKLLKTKAAIWFKQTDIWRDVILVNLSTVFTCSTRYIFGDV